MTDPTPEQEAVVEQLVVKAPMLITTRLGFVTDDMIQDGCEAMLHAHESFDARRGMSFRSWAMFRCKTGAIDGARRFADRRRQLRLIATAPAAMPDTAVEDPAITQLLDHDGLLAAQASVEQAMTPGDIAVVRRCVAGETQRAVSAWSGLHPTRVGLVMRRFRHQMLTALDELYVSGDASTTARRRGRQRRSPPAG